VAESIHAVVRQFPKSQLAFKSQRQCLANLVATHKIDLPINDCLFIRSAYFIMFSRIAIIANRSFTIVPSSFESRRVFGIFSMHLSWPWLEGAISRTLLASPLVSATFEAMNSMTLLPTIVDPIRDWTMPTNSSSSYF
jgi:hypothetical protein